MDVTTNSGQETKVFDNKEECFNCEKKLEKDCLEITKELNDEEHINTYNEIWEKSKRIKAKKVYLYVGIALVVLISLLTGMYFYNNGHVTGRTLTMNIDFRDVKGKYTGELRNGVPDGAGEFVCIVTGKEFKYNGKFSNGRFVDGMGYLFDNQNNVLDKQYF